MNDYRDRYSSYRKRRRKLETVFRWACLILAYAKVFAVLLSLLK